MPEYANASGQGGNVLMGTREMQIRQFSQQQEESSYADPSEQMSYPVQADDSFSPERNSNVDYKDV